MSERRCKFIDIDGVEHDRCPDCNCRESPIVCLPLMRIPAPPEKATKYLPEMWKPNVE